MKKSRHKAVLRFLAIFLMFFCLFVAPRHALAEEPLSVSERQNMLDDPDAVACLIDACQRFSPMEASTEVLYSSKQEVAVKFCFRQHRTRLVYASFPSDAVRRTDPQSLTCEALGGQKGLTGSFVPVSEQESARAEKDHWTRRFEGIRSSFLASKQPKKAAQPAAPAAVVQAPPAASATLPVVDEKPLVDMVKSVNKKAEKKEKAPKAKPAGNSVPSSSIIPTNSCTPETFEFRKKSERGVELFMKPGATAYDLQHSCWAKTQATDAKTVILANMVEDTIPYCLKKVGTYPSVEEFDSKRWGLGRKDGYRLKVGDAPNKSFIEACAEGHLGYALQAGQVLLLPPKGTAIADLQPSATSSVQETADAGKSENKQVAANLVGAPTPDAGAPVAIVPSVDAPSGSSGQVVAPSVTAPVPVLEVSPPAPPVGSPPSLSPGDYPPPEGVQVGAAGSAGRTLLGIAVGFELFGMRLLESVKKWKAFIGKRLYLDHPHSVVLICLSRF